MFVSRKHSVTWLESCYQRSHFLNSAGNIPSEDERKLDIKQREFQLRSHAEFYVDWIQRNGLHANQNLISRDLRDVYLVMMQFGIGGMLLYANCLHGMTSFLR